MSTKIAQYNNDGFNGAFSHDKLVRGMLLTWNDAQHWRDRDGLEPPERLLVTGVGTALQRWLGGKPQVIVDKPLPDPDDLNAAIPASEWERGVDGQPRKPWAHVVIVYGVDIAVGAPYTFISATTGAHIAFDRLMDAVQGMRMLRGDNVLPVVELGERPMKTKFGDKSRPSFNIISWKEPVSSALEELEPESQQAALSQPVTPGEGLSEKIPW
ncbi:MAG TPA: hypothetical protein VFE60_02440 [Roseiarcus sp.]|nr:hypothetical protein [Roseiarcus sp.]